MTPPQVHGSLSIKCLVTRLSTWLLLVVDPVDQQTMRGIQLVVAVLAAY
jgi:hypothetical protein